MIGLLPVPGNTNFECPKILERRQPKAVETLAGDLSPAILAVLLRPGSASPTRARSPCEPRTGGGLSTLGATVGQGCRSRPHRELWLVTSPNGAARFAPAIGLHRHPGRGFRSCSG